MSEQRIDTGADAATSTDADPGEGLGTAGPSADPRGSAGGDAEMPQPTADRPGGAGAAEPGDTEGETYLRDTQANQGGGADLGGRTGSTGGTGPAGEWAGGTSGSAGAAAGSGSGGGSGGGSGAGSSGGSGSGSPADAGPHAGEVSAQPSERRRAEDPGSVAEEFGDRAGTAPDDDIAHPSI